MAMTKVVIIELKDWRPYLSKVPDEALIAIENALEDKYGDKNSVTKKVVIKVEIMEAL